MRKLKEFVNRIAKSVAQGKDILVSSFRQYVQTLWGSIQITIQITTELISGIQKLAEVLTEAQSQAINEMLEPLAVFWERERLQQSITKLQTEIVCLSKNRNQARSQVEELKQELADLERIASAGEDVRQAMARQVQRTLVPELKTELPSQLRKELERSGRKQLVIGAILGVILELLVRWVLGKIGIHYW